MAKEKLYDKVRLGFGQSIILGHLPSNLPLSSVGNTKSIATDKEFETSKFGLFESASPNFHTYYPGVTANDLKPTEGDFVKPVFRMLSEVIVHKNINPIDFSANGILKASMPKLLGQTLYANHEALVGNELGVVSNVVWQESYKTSSGVVVPAGINAELKIDAKAHPNIARAVMMDPPSIHSNSVTVQFAWEKSHPSLSRDEFFGKLGTMGSDNQLIRRVVTDIVNYHETSFVAHGADPFAQKVGNDGQINNADYANSVYSLSALGKEKPKNYFFSYKDDITSLTEQPPIQRPINTNNNNPNENMKDLVKNLATQLNKPESEITEQFIMDSITNGIKTAEDLKTAQDSLTAITTERDSLKAMETNLTAITSERDALKTDKTNLTNKVTELEGLISAEVDNVRNEVKRLYNLIKGDKADSAKLALIDKADRIALEVDLKEFTTEAERLFPGVCQDCQSTNIARNTTKVGAQGGKGKGKKTEAEINAEIRNESRPGYIFDKNK